MGKQCEMLNLNYTDSIMNLALVFRRCDLTQAFQHCQKHKVEQKTQIYYHDVVCNTDNIEGMERRFTQHDKKNGLTCLLQYINL